MPLQVAFRLLIYDISSRLRSSHETVADTVSSLFVIFSTNGKQSVAFNLVELRSIPRYRTGRWLGLIGQFRPQKLISTIKADVAEFAKGGFTGGEEWELSAFKDFAKHFVDKSLFSLGLCTQLSLSPASSLLLSTEGHGERKGRRSKAMFFHKVSSPSMSLPIRFS
ncbi:hypothetical protein GIB67_013544 [Kingdonia uniflora]|uniref:Uncharacterized protein n=1 Tax=Kingdonia uniflora TaxID=39325 RepID=A0A7J7KUY9_9MAGN|nr:hypothetical protein GIB67_013544 [Kingdonia uniflora]